jgi:hypothetical protein
MAESAQRMLILTIVQILVGGVTIGFLWLTFRETRRTADAGIQAAGHAAEAVAAGKSSSDAAHKAANLAEESFKRLERPYIYIFGVSQIEMSGGVCVKYSVANFGRTPARITLIAAGISTHPDNPIDPLIVGYLDDPAHDLLVRPILPAGDVRKDLKLIPPDGIEFRHPQFPSNVFVTSYGNIVPVLKNNDQFFVWIRILYTGPFGGYMTNACWRFDTLTSRLVQWREDQDYNGMI